MIRVEYRKTEKGDYEIRRYGYLRAGKFFEGEKVVDHANCVAIAFDRVTYRLLGHGPSDAVNHWAEEQRKLHGGAPQLTIITFPPEFDDGEINRALNEEGYLKKLVKSLLEEPTKALPKPA